MPTTPDPFSSSSTTSAQPPTSPSQKNSAETSTTAGTTPPPSVPTTPPEPTPSDDAVIAERISIPAGSGSDDDASTGGEWKLLTAKLTSWWEGNDLGEQLNHLRQPLRIVAILVAVVLLIKVYSGLLSAIDSIPLAPRLFELVGICWMIQFSVTRLVRSDERRDVLQSLRERWNSFTGSKN